MKTQESLVISCLYNASTSEKTQCRLYCPFYEELQAPNIRFHTIVLDQSYRTSIKTLFTEHIYPPAILALNPRFFNSVIKVSL